MKSIYIIKKSLFINYLLLFVCFNTFAQKTQSEIDSLIIFNKTQSGIDKVNGLINISRLYFINSDTLSLKYGHQAVSLSQKIGFDEGIGKAYLFIALSYYNSSIDSAVKYFNLSSEILTKLNHEWSGYGYENSASIFREKGWFQESLNSSLNALEAYENHKDTVQIAKSMSNIGYLNNRLRNHREALLWQFKALDKIADKDYEVKGLIYGRIGISYDELAIYDSAFYFNKIAIDIFRKISAENYLFQWLSNIANTLIKQKKYVEAEQYIKEAFEHCNSDDSKANVLNNLGKVYLETGRYNEASKMLDSAIYYANKNSKIISLSETYYRQYELKKRQAKYFDAMNLLQRYCDLKDSIYDINQNEQIANMQVRYSTNQKEKELLNRKIENEQLLKDNAVKDLSISEEKSKKKLLIYFFTSLGLVLILLFIGLYYRFKINASKEKHKQEKLRFKAMIEAEEKERIRIARELHDGLGQFLSTTKLNISALEDEVSDEDKILVQTSLRLIDDAVKEVRAISHDLMPVALTNYGLIPAIKTAISNINESKIIKVELKTEGMENRLEQTTEIALYRVIQEVLNNVIKHSQAKHVTIQFVKQSEKLNVTITDDGKGFDTNLIEKSTGIGWKNIYSRLTLINGHLTVESSPEKGTALYINIVI